MESVRVEARLEQVMVGDTLIYRYLAEGDQGWCPARARSTV
jgi:hypothetical protein